MADISSINAAAVTPGASVPRTTRAQVPAPSSERTDEVEISELAQLLSSLDPDDCPIRAQKVADIREAIQNGTYETEDKIDYVVTRLMEILEPSPYADDESIL